MLWENERCRKIFFILNSSSNSSDAEHTRDGEESERASGTVGLRVISIERSRKDV